MRLQIDTKILNITVNMIGNAAILSIEPKRENYMQKQTGGKLLKGLEPPDGELEIQERLPRNFFSITDRGLINHLQKNHAKSADEKTWFMPTMRTMMSLSRLDGSALNIIQSDIKRCAA